MAKFFEAIVFKSSLLFFCSIRFYYQHFLLCKCAHHMIFPIVLRLNFDLSFILFSFLLPRPIRKCWLILRNVTRDYDNERYQFISSFNLAKHQLVLLCAIYILAGQIYFVFCVRFNNESNIIHIILKCAYEFLGSFIFGICCILNILL